MFIKPSHALDQPVRKFKGRLGINMTMKTFFTLHITSCEKHSTEWRLPPATVTTDAKPHSQQQRARDLEVERAVMGQRCRRQSLGEVQPCLYSSSSTSNERTEEMGTFLWLIDF